MEKFMEKKPKEWICNFNPDICKFKTLKKNKLVTHIREHTGMIQLVKFQQRCLKIAFF